MLRKFPLKFIGKLLVWHIPVAILLYCAYSLVILVFGGFWYKSYLADTTIVRYNGPNPVSISLFCLFFLVIESTFLWVISPYFKEWNVQK
jgi:hypothetical protein